jgi:hypothetical protein
VVDADGQIRLRPRRERGDYILKRLGGVERNVGPVRVEDHEHEHMFAYAT